MDSYTENEIEKGQIQSSSDFPLLQVHSARLKHIFCLYSLYPQIHGFIVDDVAFIGPIY